MSVVAEFSAQCKKSVANLKTGLTVRVHQKIQEGEKTRIQIFEGLVIRINPGTGADSTFTVRKIVDGIGVEKIFPLYSANVSKIEVKKASRVRRSKLYYMRERSGKRANLKGLRIDLSQFQAPEEKEKDVEAPEAPEAPETPKAPEAPEAPETPKAPEAQNEEKIEEEKAKETEEKIEE